MAPKPTRQITPKQISGLDGTDLAKLVRQLLLADVEASGILRSSVHVTADVNIPDNGKDGTVIWEGEPAKTQYLPRRHTVIQCKAGKFAIADCREELAVAAKKPKKGPALKSKGKKPQPDALALAAADVLENGGAYLLICSKQYPPDHAPKISKKLLEVARGFDNKRAEKAKFEFYDANKLADWVNCYPSVIEWARVHLFVLPSSLGQSWEEWSGYPDYALPYFPTTSSTEQQSRIREWSKVPKSVVRIVGHAGLGKTRLVLEAFRPRVSNISSSSLSANLIYIRSRALDEVIAEVRSIRQEGRRVILVVDDCPVEAHRDLSREVTHANSNLSLITIDYDATPSGVNGEKSVEISQSDDGVIREILEAAQPGMPEADRNRIVTFAEGYPQIAVLMANSLTEGSESFAQLNDEKLVEKLAAGRRAMTNDQWLALRACAAFDAMGVEGQLAVQLEFAATEMARLKDGATLSDQLTPFLDRRVVQPRGFSLVVVPPPLAISLAVRFWNDNSNAMVQLISQKKIPEIVARSLFARLEQLSGHKRAQEVASTLLASYGPFGNAEALETEFGAQCFRALSEVNPAAALATLNREIALLSDEDLKAMVDSRRQLVWALDGIIWRSELFSDAAGVLLRLAAAENEPWGNNATGLLVQRFQILLSGTEASLATRIEFLHARRDHSQESELRILVKCLGRALDRGNFSRIGGSEAQGTAKSFSDYRPATWGEINSYQRTALRELVELASRFPVVVDDCRSELVAHLFSLVQGEYLNEIREAIRSLRPQEGKPWRAAIEAISRYLRFGLSPPSEESEDATERLEAHRRRVEPDLRQILAELEPQNLRERIEVFIVEGVWDYFDDHAEDDTEARILRLVAAIADEASAATEALPDIIETVSSRSAQFGFQFGRELALRHHDPSQLLSTAFEILKGVDENRRSFGFLAGVINVCVDMHAAAVSRVLDEVAESNLVGALPLLSGSAGLSAENVNRMIEVTNRGQLKPENLRSLTLGRPFELVPLSLVADFLRAVAAQSPAHGWVALYIASMIHHYRPDARDDLKPIMYLLVGEAELLRAMPSDVMSSYHYKEQAKRLLENSVWGERTAIAVSREIIHVADAGDRLLSNRDIEELGSAILKLWPEVAFPIFLKALTGAKPVVRFRLQHFLGRPFDSNERHLGALFRLPLPVIKAACIESPDSVAPFVAGIAPLLVDESDGQAVWSPIMRWLLHEFGSSEAVLDSVQQNMGTFGWRGPLSGYWSRFIGPLESLRDSSRGKLRKWAVQTLANVRRQVVHLKKSEEEERIRR